MKKKAARPANYREVINEHDLTVRMLDVLRSGTLIKEEKNDSITVDGEELANEIKSFENTIGISGDIKGYRPLVVYPYDNNVEWGGDFHNGITWTFSLRNGTNIGGDIQIDDQELELINKIKQYGDIWKNEWAKKLRTDYKVQSTNTRREEE